MKKRLLALFVAMALLLTGCGMMNVADLLESYSGGDYVRFSDMEYVEPKPEVLEEALADVLSDVEQGKSAAGIMEEVYEFYEVYDRFYTSYRLSDIYYSMDLTDENWQEAYDLCGQMSAAADEALDTLYYALAASPFREQLEARYFGEGYFDSYEGESIWDDTLQTMLEEENRLQNAYYELCEQEDGDYSCFQEMAELYVELIALRQEIAAWLGYDSYSQFAYDFYYYRDYTPEEATLYCEAIGRTLRDVYREMNVSDVWDLGYADCPEAETFRFVADGARAMGGTPAAAFDLLEQAELYDISYGENKFYSSFEVFLWTYYEPFVFVCPDLQQRDKLAFAHEFGHFANDYAVGGSLVGTDVAEVQSQTMEYLCLCYTEDAEELTRYKLADSLCTYVEQAAYALFEQRAYALTEEELSVEALMELYEQIGMAFGFDSWGFDARDFVGISHFYTQPMYVISYVVSNDLAMQIYEMELEQPGKGLEVYESVLTSEDSYILDFAEEYGLESPFREGSLDRVLERFTQIDFGFCLPTKKR